MQSMSKFLDYLVNHLAALALTVAVRFDNKKPKPKGWFWEQPIK